MPPVSMAPFPNGIHLNSQEISILDFQDPVAILFK